MRVHEKGLQQHGEKKHHAREDGGQMTFSPLEKMMKGLWKEVQRRWSLDLHVKKKKKNDQKKCEELEMNGLIGMFGVEIDEQEIASWISMRRMGWMKLQKVSLRCLMMLMVKMMLIVKMMLMVMMMLKKMRKD